MARRFPGLGGMLLLSPSVRLNVVAPIVAYWILSRHGLTTTGALAVSAVFPAAGAVLAMLRSRKPDPVAVLSLAAIAVGLVAGLAFHNGRVLLVKESLITGTLGVAFLASLLGPTPLIVVLRRRRSAPHAGTDDHASQSGAVRAQDRRTTAIWGAALLAEAAIRVFLSYLLPTGTMVSISPLVAPLILGPVAVWTLRPRRTRQTTPEPSATESLLG